MTFPWHRSSLATNRSTPRERRSRRARQQVIPFFAFPQDVHRVIYTTNAIESLHMPDGYRLASRPASGRDPPHKAEGHHAIIFAKRRPPTLAFQALRPSVQASGCPASVSTEEPRPYVIQVRQ